MKLFLRQKLSFFVKSFFLFFLLTSIVSAFFFLSSSNSNIPKQALAAVNSIVYSDSLSQGWGNWSYGATTNLAATNPVHLGTKSISVATTRAWGALYIGRNTDFDVSPYTNIRFYVNGGSNSNQKYFLNFSNSDGTFSDAADVDNYIEGGSITANQWKKVDIPLSSLSLSNKQINGIHLQADSIYPAIYVDDIELYSSGTVTQAPTSAPAPGVGISVNIDTNANNHPISPLIYGISTSGGSKPYYKDMGVSLVRWGGNARTRHNWEINASNAGSDWEFRNVGQGAAAAGKASLDFVNSNKSVGAESLLTIPMIGWVSKDGNNNSMSTGVPSNGGSAVSPGSDIAKLCNGNTYDPTANRNRTSVKSVSKKNSSFSYPPDLTDGIVYQDEWVNYLKNTLGSAQNGGVNFYAMDNEMDLWDSTHVDVHPVRPGYDDTLKLFSEYAKAIKTVDSTAKVTGPVGWGWLSIWYSALDAGCGSIYDENDRKAHGNMPFYQWFLQKVKEHDTQIGYRTLDVLDVHFGSQPRNKDEATRLRATKSWWDPNYADEGWMAQTEGGPYLQFLPRLQGWINQYYPGTKIGITEWYEANGLETKMIGALLLGEDLGIFGREDVYLATYWGQIADKTPGYWAWRMFRNYDGAYSRFGDVSVKAATSDDYKVSAYASKDSKTGGLKVMLINKMPSNSSDITLNASNFNITGSAKVYQYSQQDLSQIRQLPDLSNLNGSINANLPPYSITLFVINPGVTPPTPGVCNLSSASWGNATAVKSSQVFLNVSASGDCSGKEITYEVRRNGLPLVGDIPAEVQPQPSVITGTTTSSSWITEYNPQWPGTDPEYYFKATLIGGNTIESNPRLIKITSGVGGPAPTPSPPTVVYSDSLSQGWGNWSYGATTNLAATNPVHLGTKSISVATTRAWGALYIGRNTDFDVSPYTNIRFYVNGGSNSNQKYFLNFSNSDGTFSDAADVDNYIEGGSITANQWKKVDIPLSSLSLSNKQINGIHLQADSIYPAIYVDDIELYNLSGYLPLPTTAPGACNLSSAFWGDTTAVKGSQVSLNISATGDCSSKQVTYEVRRNGAVGDIPAEIQPQASTISGTTSSTTWTAEYNPLVPGTDPEYYFKATVAGGNTIESNPRLIKISSETGGGPSPTSVPTPTQPVSQPPAFLYKDSLSSGWDNWSWGATINLASATKAYSGTKSISYVLTRGWGALYLGTSNFDTSLYTNIRFYINGGTGSNQKFDITASHPDDSWSSEIDISPFIEGGSISSNQWRKVDIPLSSLSLKQKAITGIALKDGLGSIQPAVYIDEIEFYNASFPTQPVPTSSEQTPTPTAPSSVGSLTQVFSDSLSQGWGNWSYGATTNLAATNPVHLGTKSISVATTRAWGALYIGRNTDFDVSPYTNIRFYVNGGSNSNQKYFLNFSNSDGTFSDAADVDNYIEGGSITANQWKKVDIPLSSLSLSNKQINGIHLQADSIYPAIYVDDIELYSDLGSIPIPTPTPGTCNLSSASWGGTNVIKDSQVTLNITGTGDCLGKQVIYEVRRNGIIGDVPAQTQPQPSVISGTTSSTSWIAEFNPLVPGTDPEYYFKATVQGGNTIESNPRLIKVISGGGSTVPTPTLTPTPTQAVSQPPFSLYNDSLTPGWSNWSWGSTVNLASTTKAFNGTKSISYVLTRGWGALYLGTNTFDTTNYTNIRFYVNGGTGSNQRFDITVSHPNDTWSEEIDITPYIEGGSIAANQWKKVDIPLSALYLKQNQINGMALKDSIGSIQPAIYIDDIEFYNTSSQESTSSPTPIQTQPTPTPTAIKTPTPTPTAVPTISPNVPSARQMSFAPEVKEDFDSEVLNTQPKNWEVVKGWNLWSGYDGEWRVVDRGNPFNKVVRASKIYDTSGNSYPSYLKYTGTSKNITNGIIPKDAHYYVESLIHMKEPVNHWSNEHTLQGIYKPGYDLELLTWTPDRDSSTARWGLRLYSNGGERQIGDWGDGGTGITDNTGQKGWDWWARIGLDINLKTKEVSAYYNGQKVIGPVVVDSIGNITASQDPIWTNLRAINNYLEGDDFRIYVYPSTSTPTLTPTPTPTPTAPCTLSSALWGGTTAVKGSQVSLNVNGDGNCSGKKVNFEVRRNGLPLIGDIPAEVQPQPITLASSQGITYWTTESNSLIPGTDAEYYFKATLEGENTIKSNPRLIKITSTISQVGSALPIYSDSEEDIKNFGGNCSYYTNVNFAAKDFVRSGTSSISVQNTEGNWGAFSFCSSFDVSKYNRLRFYINGGSGSNQQFKIAINWYRKPIAEDNTTFGSIFMTSGSGGGGLDQFIEGGSIKAGEWRKVDIPFSRLGQGWGVGGYYTESMGRLAIQDISGGKVQPAIYIDNIELYNDGSSFPEPPLPEDNWLRNTNKPGSWWIDCSWDTNVNNTSTDYVYQGKYSSSLKLRDGWGALSLCRWPWGGGESVFDTSPYTHFRFYINGGKEDSHRYGIQMGGGPRLDLDKYVQGGSIVSGQWRKVDIPLEDLDAKASKITRISLQDITGQVKEPVYVDNLEFYAAYQPSPIPSSIPELPLLGTKLYSDSLASGWANWSWSSTVNLSSTLQRHTGNNSIAYIPGAWGALYIGKNDNNFDTAPYTNLRFYINGGTDGDQKFDLTLSHPNNTWSEETDISPYIDGGSIQPNQWKKVDIPLSSLSLKEKSINGIALKDATGQSQPRVFVDDIEFYNLKEPTLTPTMTPTSTPSPSPTLTPTPSPSPTPTLTPTPTPEACVLSSAHWDDSSVSKGSKIDIKVSGKGDCGWKVVAYEVRRNGTLGDDVSADVQPFSSTMVGSETSTFWMAEHNPLVPGTDPEYYFKATLIGGNTIESNPRLIKVVSGVGGGPLVPTQRKMIYSDSLDSAWIGGSYNGAHNFEATDYAYSGKYSVSFQNKADNWGALSISSGEDVSKYNRIKFFINGGTGSDQKFGVYVHWYRKPMSEDSPTTFGNIAVHDSPRIPLNNYIEGGSIKAGEWRKVDIPLSDFDQRWGIGGYFPQMIGRFAIQDTSGGKAQPAIYIDDIEFYNDGTSFPESPLPEDNWFRNTNKPGSWWIDCSWDTNVNNTSSDYVYQGKYSTSLKLRDGWGAFSVCRWPWGGGESVFDTSPYTHFKFYINGGKEDSHKYGIQMGGGKRFDISRYIEGGSIKASEWRKVEIPLSDLGAENSKITRISLQDITGKIKDPVYIDNLEFYSKTIVSSPTPTPTPKPCALSSASWTAAQVNKGENINLNIASNGDCNGRIVSFEVRRNGTLGGDVAAINQPISSTIIGNKTSSLWTAEYNSQFSGTDPEYYFKATLTGGNTIESHPRLIKVVSPAEATPTPIPTPTEEPTQAPARPITYSDFLLTGWDGSTWSGTYNEKDSAYKYSGDYSLSFENTGPWGYLDLYNKQGIDTTPYTNLRFYVHGGGAGSQIYVVKLKDSQGQTKGGNIHTFIKEGSIDANTWRLVDVPLSAIGIQGKTISNLFIQDASGKVQPKLYIDNIEFYKAFQVSVPTSTSTPTPSIEPTLEPTLTTVPPTFTPVPTSGIEITPASYLSGDINQDGKINNLDAAELFKNWGASPSDQRADINKDGVVNALDFSMLISQWKEFM